MRNLTYFIKDIINKIKSIYHKYNLQFYFSIVVSTCLGIFALINTIIYFSYITLCYSILSFCLALAKGGIFYFTKKNNQKILLLYSSISLLVLTVPLVLVMVLTILYKDKPVYLFYWLIYAYALYGTIKIATSIITMKKEITKEKRINNVNTYFSLVSSLYTIQMIEFSLISTFGNEEKMYLMQLMTQGIIFIFCLYLSVKLFIRFVKYKNSDL